MNVTVVGAGVVGCAVAHELASRGAHVRLVDSRGAGRGATGASAGILAPYVESHGSSFLRLGLCSLALWDDFILRVRSDSGQPVEYERSGTLQVAVESLRATDLAEAARHFQATGTEHALLDAHEASRLEPGLSDRVTSALLLPQHGYVGPAQLIAALEQAATSRGVRMTTARVLRVEDGGQDVSVITDDETIQSDAVVLAAGTWPIQMGTSPQPPVVKPIRGQLVHLSLEGRPASRVVWGVDCYIVPWCDGSVLVGATVEDVGFDERATADGVRGLLNAAVDLMPALRQARFHEVRVGLRPKTADELPVIGRSSTMPHVFHAAGHYRNGVLLAPLTAALIADLVLDGRERPELALVRPDRLGL